MDRVVTAAEFKKRLAALCLSGGGHALPRKRRDQLILLRSVLQTLDASRSYEEKELNSGLKKWLADIGTSFTLDHASLRRYLVDEGYLVRNSEGSAYQVRFEGRGETPFEDSVQELNPRWVLEQAREEAEERKRAHARGLEQS